MLLACGVGHHPGSEKLPESLEFQRLSNGPPGAGVARPRSSCDNRQSLLGALELLPFVCSRVLGHPGGLREGLSHLPGSHAAGTRNRTVLGVIQHHEPAGAH